MAAVPPLTRRYSTEFRAVQDGLHCFYSTSSKKTIRRFSYEFYDNTSTITKMNNKITTKTSRKDVLSPVYYASEKDSVQQHKKSLESYLDSLHIQAEPELLSKAGSDDNISEPELLSKAGSDDNISEPEADQTHQAQAKKGLQSLERCIAILKRLKEDAKSEDYLPLTTGRNASRMTEDSAVRYMNVTKQKSDYARDSESSSLFDVKDSANLYLISILVSMNIAVFLFEIASPIKNSDNNLWSLPLMYGAKVNDLIMVGEWWRLVTPMFLHAGFVHIALSSWMVLSFGPQVCKGYGALTFFLIYVLGGISGNFTSFLHTSDPTVGGSGPGFAVLGAWLIYQAQNKDATGKENFETMFQRAIGATAVSFVLANFGPIDNWTNLGAAISGIIYGYFTSPVVQIDDASSTRMKEEITLSRNPANPCKSFIIFTLFVFALTSLLFFAETPLDSLELQELVQIAE